MHPAYQRLAQNEEPRSPVREIGVGLALLLAIVLGFLFLPALPGEDDPAGEVGAAPPVVRSLGDASVEAADPASGAAASRD